jgi:uncharacterized cupredoxin-like copper-binding protein
MRDYLFLPGSLSLVPGETVRFNVINGGLLPHEFALGDAAVQQAWASADAVATPPVLAATPPPASVRPEVAGLRIYLRSGEQQTVTYVVPERGELMLACNIPGHVSEGMVATVTLSRPAGDGRRP